MTIVFENHRDVLFDFIVYLIRNKHEHVKNIEAGQIAIYEYIDLILSVESIKDQYLNWTLEYMWNDNWNEPIYMNYPKKDWFTDVFEKYLY